MSDDNEDVVVPIVEYDDGNDFYGEDSPQDSDSDRSEKRKKNPGIRHYNKDDSDYSDHDKYIDRDEDEENEKDYNDGHVDSDDEIESDGKKKKKKVKKAYGIDMTPPDELLKDARKHSKVLASKGKKREAVLELVRAIALTRIVYGDGHWQLAQAYTNLAEGYLDLLSYVPQAVGHAETAKQIMGTSVHTAKNEADKTKILEVKMNTWYILGRALAAQKKFPESEKSFIKCESIHKNWAKSGSISLHDIDMEVKIAIALAKVSLMQEKFANASNQYEKALDLLESSKGNSCKELIPVYQGLGKVELAKGRLGNSEQAINMFQTAHTINSGLYKTGSLPTADTGLALANAYSSLGDIGAESSAESYLNECLTVYLTHHGPNHKTTVHVQDELVKLLVRTERLDEAVRELKSAVKAKEEVFGDYSQEVADAHKLLANIHMAKGNMEGALRSYKNCSKIETMLYGANHKRVKDIQTSIDMLMANPKLAAKQPKSKQDELKERPRFSSIAKSNKS